jgi:hypothetical protein
MSVFIVSDQSIDEMTTSIIDESSAGSFFDSYSCNTLSTALLEMNAEAFDIRYEVRHKPELSAYGYKRREQKSLMQLYKTFTCFLYQCNMDKVPESDLYKAVEAHACGIARSIIYLLPEFDQAEWS